MKVENKIHIYSINGEDTKVGDTIEFKVSNVLDKKLCVELQIGDGIKIVVLASDLEKAIKNSTNNDN